MAMVACPNCGHSVSATAPACIYCGQAAVAQTPAASEAESAPVSVSAPTEAALAEGGWILKRGHKQFGPMSGQELIGYFTSKMAVATDTVTGPGWPDPVTANDAARLLQVPAPLAARATAPPLTHIVYAEPASASSRLPKFAIGLGLLLLLAVFGVFFVLKAPPKAPAVAATSSASDGETALPTREFGPADPSDTATVEPSVEVKTGSRDRIARARALQNDQNWQGLLDETDHWTSADLESATAWNFRGIAFARLREYAQAIDAEKQAVQLEPGNATAWSNLANDYLVTGNLPEAEASARRAVALDGSLALAWNNLGVALQAQGKQDDAMAAYQRALVAKPDYAIALANVGDQYFARKLYPEAIDAYQKALAASPGNEVATRGLANAQQMLARSGK